MTPNQLSISAPAGTSATKSVKVTNLGPLNEIVHAQARALTTQVSNQTGSVNLNSGSPTFVDQFGAARRMRQVTFTIPGGTDRLVAFDSWTEEPPAWG